ncbi:uncharacterized protein [Oryza sativa Japonica Group]|uniref:uncharacterized protein isoform X2 n=1 Tax=Oryza sativa subsp. japonica TaxID=39947 RepID=UPI0007754F96|nr:uncharacterized protein LOC4333210 isoform X2 [Oryza sativa Japonica Group]
MGGGNGQKSRMARERNMEKAKGAKGSQLETNKKAMNIQATADENFRPDCYWWRRHRSDGDCAFNSLRLRKIQGDFQGDFLGKTMVFAT